MSLKELLSGKKQEHKNQDVPEDHVLTETRNQELCDFALEMRMGCGMIPPCGFPEGIWHLY